MITFIFNVVTFTFHMLAEYESKKIYSKFANVTPAFSCYILLSDQISLSGFLYFVEILGNICVAIFC